MPSPQAPITIKKPAPKNTLSIPTSKAPRTSPARPSIPEMPLQPEMLLQPETRPISHAQLAAEVKGIYAGLVVVEAKCVDVDEKQSIAAPERDLARQTKLSNEQWQALIALHRTLLHEHHDFFLAFQHPSAGPALTRLAAQYSMPGRMWRHGIHSFLEVLRHRLPESLDHMLAFIYIAYSMMALLYETVTAFEDTWIECLGDLGRYRMAIEDVDRQDREVWSGVAHFWYSKAADRNPHIGPLYHHLAILDRPGSFEQLSFCTRSLIYTLPFAIARSSIMALFRPILDDKASESTRLPQPSQVGSSFFKARGILFTGTASLYGTVAAVKDTWIEWLGDLGRYRMAFEDDEPDVVSTSWAYRRLNALSSLPDRLVRVLGFALSIRLASASSPGNDISPALEASSEWPFGPSVPSFSSWPFAVFGIILAGLSHSLARRLGPSRVSGTMMAVFGFVWLQISRDETTTPTVLWT